MTEEKYIDCTPTWIDILQMAQNLVDVPNIPLLAILSELEKPCQLVDEWNQALKNPKEHQPKED